MKRLGNKVALVTSSTKGIGLACALKLADHGAAGAFYHRLITFFFRSVEVYGEHLITFFFILVTNFLCSIYAPNRHITVCSAGKIDILVNNFGIGRPAEDLDLLHGKEDAFFDILDLNLWFKTDAAIL